MAHYRIIEDEPEYIIIEDVGPWDQHKTITNDVESVVRELAKGLGDRKLFYVDSSGIIDRILVLDGKFNGFSPDKPPGNPKRGAGVPANGDTTVIKAPTQHLPRDAYAFENGFRKTNPDWKGD